MGDELGTSDWRPFRMVYFIQGLAVRPIDPIKAVCSGNEVSDNSSLTGLFGVYPSMSSRLMILKSVVLKSSRRLAHDQSVLNSKIRIDFPSER